MINKVVEVLNKLGGVLCTACRYCTDGCPMHISIPDLFACYNAKKQFNDWNSNYYYGVHTKDHGKASECIGCGQCEGVCPHNRFQSLSLYKKWLKHLKNSKNGIDYKSIPFRLLTK